MRTICLGWKQWPVAARTHRPRCHSIHFRRQRRDVDVRLGLGQRIAQQVDLLAVMLGGEQVVLDRAALFYRIQVRRGSGRRNFTKSGSAEVF